MKHLCECCVSLHVRSIVTSVTNYLSNRQLGEVPNLLHPLQIASVSQGVLIFRPLS